MSVLSESVFRLLEPWKNNCEHGKFTFIWYEIFIHLQFFIVGVKDGMRNGTISKRSCPSVFEVLLQAFVIVAIVSALKTFLPRENGKK